MKLLDAHRAYLNEHEYRIIAFVISNHALEGLYANSKDIQEMITIIKGAHQKYTETIIAHYLQYFATGKVDMDYLMLLDMLFGAKNMDMLSKQLLESCRFPVKSLIELGQKAKAITLKRELMLRLKVSGNTLNYKYYKNMHYFIFQDIYSWAGQDRYEMDFMGQFGKNDMYFCLGAFVPKEAHILFGMLSNNNYFQHFKKQEWIEAMTFFYADLYILQPFREGNGIISRIFIQQLAHLSQYELDFSLVSQKNMLSALFQAHKGNLKNLHILIETCLRDIRN